MILAIRDIKKIEVDDFISMKSDSFLLYTSFTYIRWLIFRDMSEIEFLLK
jgi:hypothetical protein